MGGRDRLANPTCRRGWPDRISVVPWYLVCEDLSGYPMSRFLFGMITGAVLLYAAMHYHIVRGNDGVFLVPKISNNLSDIYVDTREFGLGDWQSHKPLAAAIMQSNQSHLLGDSSLASFRATMQGLVDGLFSNR